MTRAVRVSVPDAEAELAADALWQAGAVAIEEQRGALIAAAGDGDPAALLAALAGRWQAEVVTVDLAAALDAWREHASAVTVGDRLVVRPPWVDPPWAYPPRPAHGDPAHRDPAHRDPAHRDPANRDGGGPGGVGPGGARSGPRVGAPVDVVIDPGRVFGHGAHPSTRLVLDALVELVGGGERVLDIGCGSGVLAVAALALGAGTATGVDLDPAAVAATRDNAARNGVADRLAVVGTVAALDDVGGHYDLVVANMLLPDLVGVAPVVAGAVAAGGAVVVSGLLVDQGDDALAAYEPYGLGPASAAASSHRDGWLALTLRAG